MSQPITNQAGFRGRNDNGSETAATWKAILDANWTQLVDVKFRVRFLLTNTGDKDEADGYRLFYSHNSGTYTQVTTTSDVIQSTGSANTSWNLTDGDDTTQQLGSGTFDTGDWDDNGQTDSFTLVQAHETELEWCLTIDSATVGNGDSVELRVYFDDDTVLDNYLTNKTPNITVSEVSVVNFSATLASVTTTPDTAVLGVAFELAATLASATTTPDTVVLVRLPVNFQAVIAAETTTPGTIPTNWWDPGRESLSVWSAYQPKDAASLAASYTDLSGENHDTTVGVVPDWDAVNGWKFNGTDDYLITAFVPANDQSQSMIVQFTNHTLVADGRYLAGSRNLATDDRFYICPDSNTQFIYYGNGNFVSASASIGSGNLAVAGNQGYLNGVADGAAIGVFGAVPNRAVWIGCLNQGNAPIKHIDADIQAIAIYDATLTSTQVGKIATAMARSVASSLSVSRGLGAILAAATATPDNAILSVPGGVVSFLAILASATTTPDAATIAVIRELLAVLASTTATPDTVILAVSRALDAVLACETTTPDIAAITVMRELVAELASTTTTPDTVALDKIVALLTVLATGTTTPDTTLLALSKVMVAALASATTTPDTAILSVSGLIEFLATLASTTTTPDVVLAVTRELVAALASATTTPDATLSLVLEFVAGLDSASTTPDGVVLGLSLELLAAVAASTTTPDSTVIGLAWDLAAVLAAATTTPDDAVLSVGAVDVYFSAILAAITAAPDDVMVNVARELVAVIATATTSPDDAELYAFRTFLAALATATTTPDAVLDFLLGSGKPIGIMMQRPTHWILALGNLGAVQTYVPSASDWWDPGRAGLSVWAAYQPKKAASLAASYTDLSGNGHDAGVGVAPAWGAVDGWKFNGSTQYLTTTFVPQDDQTQSMIVQYTTLTTREVLCGAFTSPDGFFLRGHHNASDEVTYRQGIEGKKVSPQLLAGNLCVAGNQGYRNGVVDGSTIGGYTIVPAHSTYIGCLNMDDVADLFDAVYIQALAIYDCILTGPQVAAVAMAMAAL